VAKELADSRAKVYLIPVRSITSNTNPRQALSASLDAQGWTVFHGDQPIWPLATSDNPEERAQYVKLIQDFDPEIVAMANTMLTQGQLQAVEVREGGSKSGDHSYTLSFGCRRCLAILYNWCLLGKPKEPVVNATMIKGNEGQLLQRAIVENIRKQPNAIEEAKTIKMLINNGQSKEEVATELGFTTKTLGNRLKLLGLPPEQQKKIEAGKLTATKALAEKNGTPAKTTKPMRTRKEVTAAMEEFPESRPERKVLEWMLGMREKIA